VSPLASRFVRYVRSRGLIRPDDRVLVALSGGVDSVVLLHLLKSASNELQIEVRAAHFDHAMRTDSAADAEWVRAVCSAWHIPLTAARADRPLRGETAARLARYEFLERAARATRSSRIATAHHADDQIETVLFRLLRGTGMRGLAGIPVRRGRFIRPLLRFHKSELLAYAAAHDIAFREDPSNAQLDYARNRLRRTVLPALDAVRPEAAAAVLSLARHAARTERAWSEVLAHAEKDAIAVREKGRVELARPVLLEYHPDLRVRLLRHVLRGFATVPSRAESLQLAAFVANADSGASTRIGGVRIERVFDRFRIERAHLQVPHDSSVALVSAEGQGTVVIGGTRYQVRWQTSPERTGDEVFDAGVAATGLELRGWRPGDRIRLAYGTKKVKKLFAEKRVAVSDRARIPVLSDSHGRVLWVVGVARSVDAPAGDAVPALNITVSNAEPS
jgi:tRNA(Ile)-lysidine synthase